MKIECPECQGFGYHKDLETKKLYTCKKCKGWREVEK